MSNTSDILQPGVDIRPRIEISDSKILLEKLYGITCKSITELNAYDDKNYKIKAEESSSNNYISKISEEGYVFKIMNSLDSKKIPIIDAQNELMLFLGKHKIKCPKPIKNKKGEYFSLEKLYENFHVLRLFEFLPGKIFHDVPPTPELFYDAGKYLANLNSVLKNFYHDAYKNHRTLWMLESVPEIKQFLYVIKNADDKKIIEEIIVNFECDVLRNMGVFEKAILHGDFNEQNIVVQQKNGVWTIDSILDFGDSQYSCLLFELAIAVTYMIIQGKELNVAGHFLAGYSAIRNIPSQEYNLLKVCVAARFCQSLVMGVYTSLQHPENKYVSTTQEIGWTLLRKLWAEPSEELYIEWRRVADTHKS